MRRPSDIDLRLLRSFCTVVDCNGFRNTQIALNEAQSTLSTHGASLASSLGTKLCKPGRGGFRLTAIGEPTHLAAVELFRWIGAFQSKTGRVPGREAERLRPGVIDTLVTHKERDLPAAIAAFISTVMVSPMSRTSVPVRPGGHRRRRWLAGVCGQLGQHR